MIMARMLLGAKYSSPHPPHRTWQPEPGKVMPWHPVRHGTDHSWHLEALKHPPTMYGPVAQIGRPPRRNPPAWKKAKPTSRPIGSGSPSKNAHTLPGNNMEVENHLFVVENGLPRGDSPLPC